MSHSPGRCLRCEGPMESGFVLDRGLYSSLDDQRWVEGDVQKSFWHGIHTKGREIFAVTTYRCERCGWLDSYATTPAKL